ncbi:MAG: hydrolase [Gemmatimonadota bacterium]
MELDAQRIALVVIDLQNGIVARALAPHSSGQVIERAASLGQRFNEIGAPLALVHVSFGSSGVLRPPQVVDEPMPAPPGGLPPDWANFVPEMASLHADIRITKRQWGAFHGTELDLQLRRRAITSIVLCGIATNFGVEGTAREAWQHNYDVIVAEDACSSMSADMHAFSMTRILPRISRVRSTAEILAALD